MKNNLIITMVMGLCILCSAVKSFAKELTWQNISRENLDLKTVLVNPDNQNVIYAGTNKAVIKTEDGGRGWRNILSVRGRSSSVNLLLFSPLNKNSLFAASDNGLFFTSNQGKTWSRIFQGRNYLESQCRAVLALPALIYLGTKGGLFRSKDGGRNWHKENGKLGNTDILAISYNKKDPNCIYVASRDGVFKTENSGESWEVIFIPHFRESDAPTQEETQDIDQQQEVSDIRYISCDPSNSSCIYVATSGGIRKSCDKGLKWEPVSCYGLLNKEVKFLLFSNRGDLYAISPVGIFEYGENRWKELSFGLLAQDIRYLTLDGENNLYAACEKGLFKAKIINSNDPVGGYSNHILAPYYKDEPNIKEVQEAAINYAEVGQEKIKRWRRQAAKKAILPKVSMGLDRNAGDLWHWETGSTVRNDDDILRKGRESLDWSVSLSWDLGELIWNSDQTSIDVRSKLMVELRDNIMDEVTKLYFERIRVKMEINNVSIVDTRKIQEKELKLQELTSSIDALTGGYFSSRITAR